MTGHPSIIGSKSGEPKVNMSLKTSELSVSAERCTRNWTFLACRMMLPSSFQRSERCISCPASSGRARFCAGGEGLVRSTVEAMVDDEQGDAGLGPAPARWGENTVSGSRDRAPFSHYLQIVLDSLWHLFNLTIALLVDINSGAL